MDKKLLLTLYGKEAKWESVEVVQLGSHFHSSGKDKLVSCSSFLVMKIKRRYCGEE